MLLFFFVEVDFFFVALFSDAPAEAAPPFLLPLVVVDALCVVLALAPGVLDCVWLQETQSAPAVTRASIDSMDLFIGVGLFELTSSESDKRRRGAQEILS